MNGIGAAEKGHSVVADFGGPYGPRIGKRLSFFFCSP